MSLESDRNGRRPTQGYNLARLLFDFQQITNAARQRRNATIRPVTFLGQSPSPLI